MRSPPCFAVYYKSSVHTVLFVVQCEIVVNLSLILNTESPTHLLREERTITI